MFSERYSFSCKKNAKKVRTKLITPENGHVQENEFPVRCYTYNKYSVWRLLDFRYFQWINHPQLTDIIPCIPTAIRENW